MKRKIYKIQLLILTLLALVGCGTKEVTTMSEQVVESTEVVKELAEEKELSDAEPIVQDVVDSKNQVADSNTQQAAMLYESEIHFIDTGNSDSILIKGHDYAVLIDGGDNDEEKTLPAYIKAQGINKLDYVIATHPDADHIGGLDGVLNEVEVGQVLVSNGDADTKTYRDFIEAIMNTGSAPSVPLVHSEFALSDGSLKVLSAADEKDPNENSIVILYTHGEDRILFMGDASQEIESKIDLDVAGDVDLIKVGHHGSRTSSNKGFIDEINPEYAVITCGAGNKYGHPHQETMTTLQDLDIPVYRTDESGTMVFTSTGNGISTNAKTGSYLPGNNDKSSSQETKPSTDKISDTNSQSQNKENVEEVVQEENGTVYFTKSGKKYHSNPDCSNMKAPIAGTVEEAGNRTPCSKCY